jgi:hypothetical protein
MKAFAKEFWPRLFWNVVILMAITLLLYATAPTVTV